MDIDQLIDLHSYENPPPRNRFFDLFSYETLGDVAPFCETNCIQYFECTCLKTLGKCNQGTKVSIITVDFNLNRLIMENYDPDTDEDVCLDSVSININIK